MSKLDQIVGGLFLLTICVLGLMPSQSTPSKQPIRALQDEMLSKNSQSRVDSKITQTAKPQSEWQKNHARIVQAQERREKQALERANRTEFIPLAENQARAPGQPEFLVARPR